MRGFMLMLTGLLMSVAAAEEFAPKGEVYQVRDLSQACDYLLEQAVNCAPEVWMQIDEQALTKEEVLRILPHRPPVLFVDRVTRLVPGEEATAEFFADPALDWFRGHFPEKAVFPGALLLEAMAQAADVMLLSLEGHRGKTPYLQGLGKANFRRPVLPGETLELRAALLADRPEMGAAVCRGQVFAENELRAEAEIVLALR